jgi:type II secretory pathway predicted ATPase ExeA
MIEARFGLKGRPFDKNIPSRDLYRWPGLEELDARLEMCKRSRGIMLLTGEPGTGKTVALRRFVDRLNAEHYLPVYLPLATVTVLDAYAQLNRAIGGQEVRSKSLLLREIQLGVAQLAAQGKQPVIILDEADLLRSALFDELRILLNFEMDSRDPLLLILAGQPQLLASAWPCATACRPWTRPTPAAMSNTTCSWPDANNGCSPTKRSCSCSSSPGACRGPSATSP